MDIFGSTEQQRRRMRKFHKHALIFTQLVNSTCCAATRIHNVNLHEEKFAINPTAAVPVIKNKHEICSYINGAVHKQCIPANQKIFQSCVQFQVPHEQNPDKVYKIKVFRNGVVQIPGVLCEDFSDAVQPLHDVVALFAPQRDIVVDELYSVMRNYKFTCTMCIDLHKLQDYFTQNTEHGISFSRERLRTWIVQHDDITTLRTYLLGSSAREISANVKKLQRWIQASDIALRRRAISALLRVLRMSFYSIVNTQRLITAMLYKTAQRIVARAENNKNNMLKFVRYNQERYSGLLIYVKTPIPGKAKKCTTIKIFESGKINIDGANNIAQARFIYWWLNSILSANPEICFINAYHDASDSEFSESEISEHFTGVDFSEIAY